jgi:oxygen-dependent protoporphyrinogen oxidase
MAARRLAQAGVAVTVVEASRRLGGQVRTAAFEGLAVDVGAEALVVASPATEALLAELRLADTSVSPRPGATWLATPRGLRRLPAGVGPAGPTRLRPVVSSRILSARGVGRAALEPLVARRRHGGSGDDVAVGDFVTHRFGREVAERFVDPLLGGIHSGDIHRLSLGACAPQLAPLHASGRSVALAAARRRSSPAAGPQFVTWPRGLSSFVLALMDGVDLDLRLGDRVTGISRDERGGGYAVRLASGPSLAADAVVLAVPSPVGSRLLHEVAPGVRAVAEGTRFATVATVLASLPLEAVADVRALRGTGLMVPSTAGRLLKAATFLSSKWSHLAGPDVFLMRLSAGRAGSSAVDDRSDAELTTSLLADLAELTGLRVAPARTAVHRWSQALAQHEVGHQERVRAARRAHAGAPGIVLAGASWDGGGVAGCLRSGEAAAAEVLA